MVCSSYLYLPHSHSPPQRRERVVHACFFVFLLHPGSWDGQEAAPQKILETTRMRTFKALTNVWLRCNSASSSSLVLLFIIDCSHALVSGTDEVNDPRLRQQHGLYHPAVVVDVPALECECIAYSPAVSSTDPVYSHVEPSSCRAGGQVDFNVAVRGLVPGFEYDLEITWTLSGDEMTHTWKSVVTAATEYYKLREPLVRRNDDFHFGMLAWDVYKKGDDRL
jgi:hypothetical protein